MQLLSRKLVNFQGLVKYMELLFHNTAKNDDNYNFYGVNFRKCDFKIGTHC